MFTVYLRYIYAQFTVNIRHLLPFYVSIGIFTNIYGKFTLFNAKKNVK